MTILLSDPRVTSIPVAEFDAPLAVAPHVAGAAGDLYWAWETGAPAAIYGVVGALEEVAA